MVRVLRLSLVLVVSILGTSCILSLSSHICNEENDCKHQAETSDNDIANGKEVVLSSEDISSGEYEMFTSFERADIEIIDDF